MCITVPNNAPKATNLTPTQPTPQSDSTQRAGQTTEPTRDVALRAVQNNNATLSKAPSQSSSSPKIGLALQPLRWSKEHKLSTTAVESQQIAASVQARLPNKQDSSEVQNIFHCRNQINKNEKYEGLLPSEADKWNCIATLAVSDDNKILQSNLSSLSKLTRHATDKESLSLGANYLAEMVDKCADLLSDPSAQTKVQEVAPRLLNLLTDPDPEGAKENSTQLEQLKQELFQLAAHSSSTQEMETIGLICALMVDVQNFSALKISQDENTAALLQQGQVDATQPAPASSQASSISELLKSHDCGFFVFNNKLDYDGSKLTSFGSCNNSNYQDIQGHLKQITNQGQQCLNACLSGNVPEAMRQLETLRKLNEPLAKVLESKINEAAASFIDKVATEVVGDVGLLSIEHGDYLSNTIGRLNDFDDQSKRWPAALREQCLNKINEQLKAQPNIQGLNLDLNLSAEDKFTQSIATLQALMPQAKQQLTDADAFVKSFGIESVVDKDKEYGTSRGGLVGLAQRLYPASFIAPENQTAPNSIQTLKNIVTTIGDIFEKKLVTASQGPATAQSSNTTNTNAALPPNTTQITGKCPELKGQLNSLMDIIENRASSYEDKVAAFQSIKAILVTLGTLGPIGNTLQLTIDNLFNANASGPNAANTLTQGNAAANANSVMSFAKLGELLKDSSGEKFNQTLSQAIKENVGNPDALAQLSALAHNLEQCFTPGSHVNSIKQNAKLAAHLSVVMQMPVVAGIGEALSDAQTPNADYHFWSTAKNSNNPQLKQVYDAVSEVQNNPSPKNLLNLNLCLNALQDEDLQTLRNDYRHNLETKPTQPNAQVSAQDIARLAQDTYSQMRVGFKRCKEFSHVITQAAYAMFAADKGIPLNMQEMPDAKGTNKLRAHQDNTEFYQLCEQQAGDLAHKLAVPNNPGQEAKLKKEFNKILTSGVGNGPIGRSTLSQAAQKLNFNTASVLSGATIRALLDPSSVHHEHIYRILNHALEKTAQAHKKSGAADKVDPKKLATDEVLNEFKKEVNADPIFGSLAAQFTDKVKAQQNFLSEQFIKHLDILGFTTKDPITNKVIADDKKLEHILFYHSLNKDKIEASAELFAQNGQTQGAMLYLLKEALIEKFEDMPDGRMANLVPSARVNAQGQPITVDPNHVWTIPELKEGLINALQTPLHQAEARVIAEKLYESLPDAEKRAIVKAAIDTPKSQTAKVPAQSQTTTNTQAGANAANTNTPASDKTYKWDEFDDAEKQAVLKQLFANDDNYFYQKGVLDSFAQVSAHNFTPQERQVILANCMKEALEHKAWNWFKHKVTIDTVPSQDKVKPFKDALRTNNPSAKKALLNEIGSENINLGLYALMTKAHEKSVKTAASNKKNVKGVEAGAETKEVGDKIAHAFKGLSNNKLNGDKFDKFWSKCRSAFVGGSGFLLNRKLDEVNANGKESVAGMLLNMRQGDTQKGAHLRAILRCGFEDVAFLSGAKGLDSVVKDYNCLETEVISLNNLNRARELDPELESRISALKSFNQGQSSNNVPTVALKELMSLLMSRYMTVPTGVLSQGAAPALGMTHSEAHDLSKFIFDAICENPSLKKTVAGFVPHTMSSFDRQELLEFINKVVHFDKNAINQSREHKRKIEQEFLTSALMKMDTSTSLAIERNGSVELVSVGVGYSAAKGNDTNKGKSNLSWEGSVSLEASAGVSASFSNALTISHNEDGSYTFEVGKNFGLDVHASASGTIAIGGKVGMTEDENRKVDPSLALEGDLGVSAEINAGGSLGGGASVTFKNAFDAAVFLQRVIERKVEKADLAEMSTFFEGEIHGSFNLNACATAVISAEADFNIGTTTQEENADGSETETTELLKSTSQETEYQGTCNIGGNNVEVKITESNNRQLTPLNPSEVQFEASATVSGNFGLEGARTYRSTTEGTTQTITHHRQGQMSFKVHADISAAGQTVLDYDDTLSLHSLDNEYNFSRDLTQIDGGFTNAEVNTTYTFQNATGLQRVLAVNGYSAPQINKLIAAIGPNNCGKTFDSITLSRAWTNPPPAKNADLYDLRNYDVQGISLNHSQEEDQTSGINKALNFLTSQIGNMSSEKTSALSHSVSFAPDDLDSGASALNQIIYPPEMVVSDILVQDTIKQSDTAARQNAAGKKK